MHGHMNIKTDRITTEVLHKHDMNRGAVIRPRAFGSLSEIVALVLPPALQQGLPFTFAFNYGLKCYISVGFVCQV